MHRHELADEQWSLVQPLLPQRTAKTGRPPSDPRLMLNGIVWVLCMGAPWRDLPPRFGSWQTVYDHFRTWRNAGTFAALVEALQIKLDKNGLIDWDLWCVDGASVRTAGACKTLQAEQSPVASRRAQGLCVGPQRRRVWIQVPPGD